MAKYKQKPVIVDARQYTGGKSNGSQLASWVNSGGSTASWMEESRGMDLILPEQLYVKTDQGEGVVNVNDWIVKIDGVFMVYPDGLFKQRFETA